MEDFENWLQKVKQLDALQIHQLRAVLQEQEFRLGICKYSEGKIYGITHTETGVLAYVGSTIKELLSRWSGHRSFYKNQQQSSYTLYIMANGGPSAFHIHLIEKYPCRSFRDLLSREKVHINNLKPPCNVSMVDKPHEDDTEEFDEDEDYDAQQNSYESIISINHNDYAVLTTSGRKRSSQQQLQVQKYWFEHVFVQNELVDRQTKAAVFDAYTADTSKERILIYKFAEITKQLPNESLVKPKAFTELPIILASMETLCSLIGLKHTHDEAVAINESILVQNKKELGECLLTLKKLLRIRGKKDELQFNKTALRTTLRSVLMVFGGVNLETLGRNRTSDGKDEKGKRQRKDNYDCRIAIKNKFVLDVLSLLQQ